MPRKKKTSTPTLKPIEQYEHRDKERPNNPPVGLVDSKTDNGGLKKRTYQYDPHLDPQLVWAGKAERTSFEIPTVSLHVHERIDPRRIIEQVRKDDEGPSQPGLWEREKKPLREAIEFYKHKDQWSNRLIAGDSLLVMNSLLEKEGMSGKVQMVYFDPPYGIKYGSNFMPFVNKKKVDDGKDEDLTAEPEMIKAFRDTWELGIHSFLTYMRDRLFVARELLADDGSIFVQISDENVHHVREVMDEVFGPDKFLAIIAFKTATNQNAKRIQRLYDYLIWYGKTDSVKFREIFRRRTPEEIENIFNNFDEGTGKRYKSAQLKDHWDDAHISRLRVAGRLEDAENYAKRFEDDFEFTAYDNVWYGTIISTFSKEKVYAVQTSTVTVERAMTMATDPGDLVLDITCGSGTTAFVAEKFGRRWITCDTSRISLTLAKQRLIGASFDYFRLAHPAEGVGSGFEYTEVDHITLTAIANGDPTPKEKLLDQPVKDASKLRITGPFTVEAVPAPYAKSPEESDSVNTEADTSVTRSGETLRQTEWIDRLKDGVRGKGGAKIEFTRVEPLGGTQFLQAEAETREDQPKRVVICFGPEHAPLEQRLVEHALAEANTLMPKPEIVLFCAFQFDPEARKDIEETNWPGVQLLEAQMDSDLQNDDLKKKPRDKTNPGFWLIGQPDVEPKKLKDGTVQVEVKGFDYYNPKTGAVESGGKSDIAMWMLDPDYDDRSLYPTQIFFPMSGDKDGWSKLAKNLKAEIDEEKIVAFRGTVSLPFKPGRKVAVKIIDARGIESLKIIHV